MIDWILRRTGLIDFYWANVVFERFIKPDPGAFDLVVTDDSAQLLRLAREHYDVPELADLNATISWLRSLGASPVEAEVHAEHFLDEHVDRNLVTSMLTINDRDLVRSHLSGRDREFYHSNALDAELDGFDPDEYGIEKKAETIFNHEVGIDRLLIVLERAIDDENAVGNFRVFGAGQWLRETLWAGTGVVPRDVGGGDSDLLGDACVLAGRERWTSDPIPGWEPLP